MAHGTEYKIVLPCIHLNHFHSQFLPQGPDRFERGRIGAGNRGQDAFVSLKQIGTGFFQSRFFAPRDRMASDIVNAFRNQARYFFNQNKSCCENKQDIFRKAYKLT